MQEENKSPVSSQTQPPASVEDNIADAFIQNLPKVNSQEEARKYILEGLKFFKGKFLLFLIIQIRSSTKSWRSLNRVARSYSRIISFWRKGFRFLPRDSKIRNNRLSRLNCSTIMQKTSKMSFISRNWWTSGLMFSLRIVAGCLTTTLVVVAQECPLHLLFDSFINDLLKKV